MQAVSLSAVILISAAGKPSVTDAAASGLPRWRLISFGQQPFDLFSGQPPGIRMFLAATRNYPPGDVVAQSLAILPAVAGRQAITGLIKELASQR